MDIKCPACGSQLCSFTKLWLTANPFKKIRCKQCGKQFKATKTGIIKYSSYLIGLLVGILLITVLEEIIPVWALIGIIPFIVIDYILDSKFRKYIKMIEKTSSKADEAVEGITSDFSNSESRRSSPALSSIMRKRRTFKIAIIVILSIIMLYIASFGVTLLTCDVAIYGNPIVSKIGDPENRIDAFVPDDHSDQHYFVQFRVISLLKGNYANSEIGLRLHSPALQFGIRNELFSSRRYVLFLKKVSDPDGTNALILQRQIRLR